MMRRDRRGHLQRQSEETFGSLDRAVPPGLHLLKDPGSETKQEDASKEKVPVHGKKG